MDNKDLDALEASIESGYFSGQHEYRIDIQVRELIAELRAARAVIAELEVMHIDDCQRTGETACHLCGVSVSCAGSEPEIEHKPSCPLAAYEAHRAGQAQGERV